MAGPEKTFENKVKTYIRAIGGYAVKYHGNAYSTNGTPDLLCCIGGRFVALEIKAENGRPTKLQEWTIRQIRQSGGIAMILYPKDWEKTKRLLKALANNNIIGGNTWE